MGNHIILNNPSEFFWHKHKLDNESRYAHRHDGGEPSRYPCIIESEWGDEQDGPYFYSHTFTYKVEVKCECCGHKSVKWPHELPSADSEPPESAA